MNEAPKTVDEDPIVKIIDSSEHVKQEIPVEPEEVKKNV